MTHTMDKKDQIARFRVIKSGPLEVNGNFTLKGSDGKSIETGSVIYLCRCGGSRNKPFCDGTHNTNGFQS